MSQALLFIVFRGLEIQMKVEGNSNEWSQFSNHKGSVTWFLSLAPLELVIGLGLGLLLSWAWASAITIP